MAEGTVSHRSNDRRIVLYATVAAALILMQQVGSKAARDALFLTTFPSRELPKIMAGSALVSLVVVLLSARAMSRLGPARLLPITLLLNAALFGIEAALSPTSAAPTALLLYLHVAALGSVLISGFWSLVTERFDPHRARQYVGRIGVGATLGGAIGGLVADGVTRLVSVQGLLLWLGLSSLAAAVLIRKVARPRGGLAGPPSMLGQQAESALGIFKKTPYLGFLGGLAALSALWAALLDYSLKSQVSLTSQNPADLMRFFGWFYTGTGILTFIVQAGLGERLLKRYGIGLTVGLLPTFVAAFSLAAGLVNAFALLVALRAIESVLANSIHRASYELFFTPLPRATKRPTKTIVDVAATRVGDAVGSGVVLLGLALIPTLPVRVPILLAAGAAFVAFTFVPRLHRGYVGALTGALRAGTIRLEESTEPLDALTQRTLAESTHFVDRDKLLQEIEAFRQEQQQAKELAPKHTLKGSTTLASTSGGGAASLEARFAATLDPVVSAALILGSRDEERIKRTLQRPVAPELTAFVTPILGHKTLGKDAEQALAALGGAITGILTDSLQDARLSRSARARVARLLGRIDSARAREGLFEGLASEAALVVLECARAIASQARAFPATPLEKERIFRAVAAVFDRRDRISGSIPPSAISDDSGGNAGSATDDLTSKLDPRVQVALALLAAVVDKESVDLAARALAAGDAALRGTALEFLENVLPEPAKSALLQTLAARPARSLTRRTQMELLQELQRSKG